MNKKRVFLQVFLIVALCLLICQGCIGQDSLENARGKARQSRDAYVEAAVAYKKLIKKRKDYKAAQLELGKLFFEHGDYAQAADTFKKSDTPVSKKYLAISYYWLGNYTDALDIFTKNADTDDESRYYHALTAEKLNLFDQALNLYRQIQTPPFRKLSISRIDTIEKNTGKIFIKDLNPQIYQLIQNAPAGKLYPQAGALVLSCDEKTEVTVDNREISSYHYVIKILNERGKEEFSETQIEYDSTDEKVELEFARTIKPDGSIADIGTRHIRDVSKYLNFPLYSNVRAYIISFPEITEGAVIEYSFKIYRNQMINKKDFVIDYPLQTQEPVIHALFALSVPQEKDVFIRKINQKYNTMQAVLEPKIEKAGEKLIYRWEFNNIPQIIPEALMPPSASVNPAILISSFSSWQEIYEWWWKLAKDKIKADIAIKDKVAQLTRTLASEEEKARAIYNYCAQKIRYVAVEYGEAGYEPHKAEDIFRNKYGDCKDQAILLVTMLREAGFTAYPVLIATRELYNIPEDFPSVMFNHCIAAVVLQGRLIFLDPTAETCAFGDLPSGDQKRLVLVCKDSGYEVTATLLYGAPQNLLRQELAIKINENESISAKKTVRTSGVYDQGQRYWLLYTPPQLVEETLKEKIQDISIGANLIGYKINNAADLNTHVELGYEFTGKEYLTAGGSLRILPQLASIDTKIVARNTRIYPLDFTILDSKESLVTLEIPRAFKIKYIPENINEDNPWFKFSVLYTQQGNTIYFLQKIEAKRSFVTQEEYPTFKDFFERLAKKVKQRIVLEKKQ